MLEEIVLLAQVSNIVKYLVAYGKLQHYAYYSDKSTHNILSEVETILSSKSSPFPFKELTSRLPLHRAVAAFETLLKWRECSNYFDGALSRAVPTQAWDNFILLSPNQSYKRTNSILLLHLPPPDPQSLPFIPPSEISSFERTGTHLTPAASYSFASIDQGTWSRPDSGRHRNRLCNSLITPISRGQDCACAACSPSACP
ncbi:hypothetical protein RRG08_037398 [Elysia crispata]|uniref:Uncharacterized protein n=1 Tax=Elysia crispata TaxID=231223 RepID=A0AAE1AG10_9GAST|nr:hypothetical protein RRG08_037398 [Elysia crispata]